MTPVSPHAVDTNDDEPKLSHPLLAVVFLKGFRHEESMRAGVDGFENRVALCRIKMAWPKDHPVNVSFSIAPLGDERLGAVWVHCE